MRSEKEILTTTTGRNISTSSSTYVPTYLAHDLYLVEEYSLLLAPHTGQVLSKALSSFTQASTWNEAARVAKIHHQRNHIRITSMARTTRIPEKGDRTCKILETQSEK